MQEMLGGLNRLRVVSLVCVFVWTIAIGQPQARAQGSFDNAAIARAGLAEVGSQRVTGDNRPGECIVSARRWVRAAGGTTAGGGTISSYERAGAVRVGSFSEAAIGDVVQYHNDRNGDWAGRFQCCSGVPASGLGAIHYFAVDRISGPGSRYVESIIIRGASLILGQRCSVRHCTGL